MWVLTGDRTWPFVYGCHFLLESRDYTATFVCRGYVAITYRNISHPSEIENNIDIHTAPSLVHSADALLLACPNCRWSRHKTEADIVMMLEASVIPWWSMMHIIWIETSVTFQQLSLKLAWVRHMHCTFNCGCKTTHSQWTPNMRSTPKKTACKSEFEHQNITSVDPKRAQSSSTQQSMVHWFATSRSGWHHWPCASLSPPPAWMQSAGLHFTNECVQELAFLEQSGEGVSRKIGSDDRFKP